jgi:hypothetical protein
MSAIVNNIVPTSHGPTTMRRDHHTNKPTRHRSLTNPPPTTWALQTRYVAARASQIINDRGIANTPAHANQVDNDKENPTSTIDPTTTSTHADHAHHNQRQWPAPTCHLAASPY